MGTNTAYYAAEQALRYVIATMDEHTLRAKLQRIVQDAEPDYNRELFEAFGINEAAFAEREG
jgi:hypothetical protein